MGAPRLRRMEPDDVAAVYAVATRAFEDLSRRLGEPPAPERAAAPAHIRLRRLQSTDPEGAWVAERDGEPAGCSIGIVRGGLWGLSLLVVDPGLQSAGLGRELLARARAHGDGSRGHVVLSSRDPRALRLYAGLGLDLHPALQATGTVRAAEPPPGVRPWRDEDAALAAAVDREVRGEPHGGDLDAMAAAGVQRLVLPGRGYVAVQHGGIKVLAARDEEAAATLLRAALATAAAEQATVEWITSAQRWAVRPCLDAGLELRALGAVFTSGEVGPFAPYLPSGAYL